MAEVKWIKITTDIFDDEKVLMIESLPSADSIIVIWFKLLTFAGKQNNDGVFIMNNRIAFTEEMLASIFRRDVNTVRMALQTFTTFGMIEIVDNVITIPNWNKHQTLDAYEKKKERDRLYQYERRQKQKQLIEKSSDKSLDCQATASSDIAISDKDIEKELDIERDKKNKRETTQTIFERLLPDYIIPDSLITKLTEWIRYKTERKEGYKEQGLKALLRQIENNQLTYGEKAVCSLIDESMANGWKGIIFEKLKKENTAPQPKATNNSTDDFMAQLAAMRN